MTLSAAHTVVSNDDKHIHTHTHTHTHKQLLNLLAYHSISAFTTDAKQ